MQLQSVMSKDVQTVESQATIIEAAKIMKEANVGMLPVLGPAGQPIGVVTDRDLALRALADGLSANAQVREAMSPKVYSVEEDQDLDAALQLMKEKKIGRVLVTNKLGGLVGVLTLTDASIVLHGDKRTAEVSEALHSRIPISDLQSITLF